MTNATNVETKHLKVGDVSYAYRELRPAKLADPTPVVFLHRFRGTLDDWIPHSSTNSPRRAMSSCSAMPR